MVLFNDVTLPHLSNGEYNVVIIDMMDKTRTHVVIKWNNYLKETVEQEKLWLVLSCSHNVYVQ